MGKKSWQERWLEKIARGELLTSSDNSMAAGQWAFERIAALEEENATIRAEAKNWQDNLPDRLKDAEADVLRLHADKMKQWERAESAEAELVENEKHEEGMKIVMRELVAERDRLKIVVENFDDQRDEDMIAYDTLAKRVDGLVKALLKLASWQGNVFRQIRRIAQRAIRADQEPKPAEPEASGEGMREYYGLTTGCYAGSDGDCIWKDCPQLRDNEPEATNRHCPLDTEE